jgi:phenylalanyl-tRNA synthetase beta chain
MPPIINSHNTGKVSESTKDIFIECSGANIQHLKKTLNILVTALADMGGEIYSMEIEDKEKFISPNLEVERVEFKIADINKVLGLNLSEKEIPKLLQKMGIGYEIKNKTTFALVPAYRVDILHWVDVSEEIAIAYGYENFKPEIPKISTIAEEDAISIRKRLASGILSGLGFLEISSYHLSTKEAVKLANPDFRDFIELEESKTEYTILRPSLLSNVLKILSENSDSSYPQKIFETGRIFMQGDSETGILEKEKLCSAICGENANFTEIKQALDYLFAMAGKKYELQESAHPSFIPGRCAKILDNAKEIGVIGEIHPRIIRNLKLKMPISAFEIDLI